MTIALQRYLQSLDAASGSLEKAQADQRAAEQDDLRAQLLAEAPGLLEQGNFNELAVGLAETGDPSSLRSLIAQGVKSQGSDAAPTLGADRLGQLYPQLAPEQIQGLEGLDIKEQRLAAQGIVRDSRAGERIQEQKRAEDRRIVSEKQGDFRKWSGDFDKFTAKVKEEERAINKVKAALKQGSLPADSVVFNFLARNLAGEKGPLSDSDIARFKGAYGEETFNKVTDYVRGSGKSTLTDAQRTAYKDLVKLASDNFEQYKTEGVAERLSRGTDFKRIFNPETGKVARGFKRRLDKFGYKLDKDDLGGTKLTRKLPTKREKVSVDESGDSLQGRLNQIQDPNVKNTVQRLIEGKPAAVVNKILENALNIGAGGQ